MKTIFLILSLALLIIGCVKEKDNAELPEKNSLPFEQKQQGKELNEKIKTMEGYAIGKTESNKPAFANNAPYVRTNEFSLKGQGRGIVPPYYIWIDGSGNYSLSRYHEEIRKILGEPLKTSSKDTGEYSKTVTWEYEDLIFIIYEFERNDVTHANIEKVLSTDKGEYLFGIKHGMHIDELKKIFEDIVDFRYYDERQKIYLPHAESHGGLVYTTIEFENDRIKSIIWRWSGK